MKANYTTPKVCPTDKSMDKPWFVYFRWTDPQTGERTSFRYKAGLNSIQNKRERIEEANALCYAITQRLKSDWNPTKKIIDKSQHDKTLIEFFEDIIELKRRKKKGTIKTYESKLRSFKDWCKKNNLAKIYPQNFTRTMAQAYLDCLLKNNQSGKSHNNHLSVLNMLFNSLVEREIIQKNPLKGIAEQGEEQGKNFPYSKEEQVNLKNWLYNNNRRMYYAAQFVYYCFIRRTELILLRVGDIDWTNKTITIPSAASKNGKQESVTIPKSFEKILLEMGLDLAPKDYYIFGYHFKTCGRPIIKPDSLTESHRRAMTELNIGTEKGFYSWKHTGVCDLYNATKDPYLVMQQCRHSDIKITMIYLRSLGLTVNERIREAVYNF